MERYVKLGYYAMIEKHLVTLKEVIDDFQLEIVTGHSIVDDIAITTSDINRPGSAYGIYGEFWKRPYPDSGMVETSYLEVMSPEERHKRLKHTSN